jgi:hypothetical protein
MSYARNGIFAAIAVATSVGAAQFASGEDLTIGMRSAGTTNEVVNRAAKTGRGPILAEPVAPTQTIDIHVDRLPSTSVLVRVPRTREAHSRRAPSSPLQLRSAERKPAIACEPVVSVLTDIAKRLPPGRCVT